MKVLLVSHSSALYGAQRSLVDLALGLRELGIEVTVTVPEPGPLRDLLLKQGFDVRGLPCRNWVHSRTAYHWLRKWLIAKGQARRAAEWIQRDRFDLIHTNSLVTPVGAMVARRIGIPHIWHVREGMPPKKDFFLMPFSKVSRFIADTTTFMIGISKHSCEGMKSFCPVRLIRLVYNGPISYSESSNQGLCREEIGDPVRLLCVGRVSKAKGHDIAARALTTLRSQGIRATLSIAGAVTENFKRELLEIAPEGLEFLGFVHDTGALYLSHDVLVMSSQREAFGRVTVEAMARGCIVVGTNSGGTPEIVEHGFTGLLFEPGNANRLAEQIRRLKGDAQLVEELRVNAHRDVFARFSRERYAREVAELYREAVDGA